MRTQKEINKELHDRNLVLELCRREDEKDLYKIYEKIVVAGEGFPYEDSSEEEFRRHFFSPGSAVYVCRSLTGEVLGGFFLKANLLGRSSHIANAAYMIRCDVRRIGLGRILCEASLLLAKKQGYRAIQYNMVLSENIPAVTLYKTLGFQIIATIPNAVRNPDNTYQTGYIMYRELKKTGEDDDKRNETNCFKRKHV